MLTAICFPRFTHCHTSCKNTVIVLSSIFYGNLSFLTNYLVLIETFLTYNNINNKHTYYIFIIFKIFSRIYASSCILSERTTKSCEQFNSKFKKLHIKCASKYISSLKFQTYSHIITNEINSQKIHRYENSERTNNI